MIFWLSALPELFGYHARMGENACNLLTENSAALDLRLSIFWPKLNILREANGKSLVVPQRTKRKFFPSSCEMLLKHTD